MRNQSSRFPIILTIILLLALCCLCISLVIFASGSIILALPTTPAVDPPTVFEQPLADLILPTLTASPTGQVISTPGTDIGEKIDTLEVLKAANVPINDPILLAEQLGGKMNISRTFPDPNAPYQVGDSKAFWVTNVDTRQNFQVIATLRYLGEHTYFWIEDNVAYEPADLVQLGDTFDQKIYPTTRAFFGSEWTPGIDHDPRIHILFARNLGEFLAGYYSSADELHPDAHQFSNAHEMFLINADNMRLWHDSIYSTLAHELQHMIHWHIDKNEETWLNEGFSMLAELINGYDPGGFDRQYIQNTDLQLTDWGSSIGSNGPHYGAAMLFTTYFYDRFGATATQKLVAEQKNGLEGIDVVLQELDVTDPLTGEPLTAEDVFADWAVANLLGDPGIGDGRYYYNVYPQAPQAAPSTHITACPTGPLTYHVAQFGVDAIKISCPGDLTLSFAGETTTNLLPITPYSGSSFFWSNTGDQSNMSLKREFDLTEVSGPVNMTYQTWYDIELDYDYVFVSASIDGTSWQILNSTSCTMNNPSGNSYGCGLTGASDGWQLEKVDLTPFAGKLISLRFDYITDAAVNGNGFALDDIHIDAINYFTNFEVDDGGWHGEGFVRIQNALPQSFRVTMITYGKQVHVVPLELDENNHFEVDINLGQDLESMILVISGTTPYTRQRAVYQVGVEPLR